MPTTLPIPIRFDVPQGWRAAPPDEVGAPDAAFVAVHPPSDNGFTPNITVDGEYRPDTATLPRIADESVGLMSESVTSVRVTDRRETGSADAPGLTQTLAFSVVLGQRSHDLLQSQVYLSLLDVDNPRRRVVIRLMLTSTESRHPALLDDFRSMVRTIRPGEGATP
ncbi:hypothetical protein [Streptomyces sp. cg40]|uniref:hypothetical protein n=1 Tax=Streptomyces sp. cg40 TaxID=3419764 RepID=UPI003D03C932